MRSATTSSKPESSKTVREPLVRRLNGRQEAHFGTIRKRKDLNLLCRCGLCDVIDGCRAKALSARSSQRRTETVRSDLTKPAATFGDVRVMTPVHWTPRMVGGYLRRYQRTAIGTIPGTPHQSRQITLSRDAMLLAQIAGRDESKGTGMRWGLIG
jgi:hypothetical protein